MSSSTSATAIALGCTQLDLWNGHLPSLLDDEARSPSSITPEYAQLSPGELEYLARIKGSAESCRFAVRLPGGRRGAYLRRQPGDAAGQPDQSRSLAEYCRAIRRASKFGSTLAAPRKCQMRCLRSSSQAITICSHGQAEKGSRCVIENHWGASRMPENVVRILEAVPGLGLLFDTGNWPEEMRETGWALCAHYARATHLKTYAFDDEGTRPQWIFPGRCAFCRRQATRAPGALRVFHARATNTRRRKRALPLFRRVLGTTAN